MDTTHAYTFSGKFSWRKWRKLPYDEIIDKIAALGIPALIFIVLMHIAPVAGAAALTWALSVLAGPFSMPVGLLTLGLIGLLSYAVTHYGFDRVYGDLVDKMKAQGHTLEEILATIDSFPISKKLKAQLEKFIRDHWGENNGSGQPD